jgi:hypothetical protein
VPVDDTPFGGGALQLLPTGGTESFRSFAF